jgi:hypothetical protein
MVRFLILTNALAAQLKRKKDGDLATQWANIILETEAQEYGDQKESNDFPYGYTFTPRGLHGNHSNLPRVPLVCSSNGSLLSVPVTLPAFLNLFNFPLGFEVDNFPFPLSIASAGMSDDVLAVLFSTAGLSDGLQIFLEDVKDVYSALEISRTKELERRSKESVESLDGLDIKRQLSPLLPGDNTSSNSPRSLSRSSSKSNNVALDQLNPHNDATRKHRKRASRAISPISVMPEIRVAGEYEGEGDTVRKGDIDLNSL